MQRKNEKDRICKEWMHLKKPVLNQMRRYLSTFLIFVITLTSVNFSDIIPAQTTYSIDYQDNLGNTISNENPVEDFDMKDNVNSEAEYSNDQAADNMSLNTSNSLIYEDGSYDLPLMHQTIIGM